MKILKGIGYGLIALLILLTGFIVVCALNPDISSKLSDVINGRKTVVEEEEPVEIPERPSI